MQLETHWLHRKPAATPVQGAQVPPATPVPPKQDFKTAPPFLADRGWQIPPRHMAVVQPSLPSHLSPLALHMRTNFALPLPDTKAAARYCQVSAR